MILFKIHSASVQRMRISKYSTSLTLWGGIILIVLPELEKEEKKNVWELNSAKFVDLSGRLRATQQAVEKYQQSEAKNLVSKLPVQRHVKYYPPTQEKVAIVH